MDNTSEARRKKIMRRKRAMLKRTHRRINVTFIIVFVLLLVLGVRIFMINYTHGEEYSQAVLNHQTYTSTTIPYMRGNITASDGTVLAYSEKVYNLILDVKSVTSEDGKYLNNTIDALVKCFVGETPIPESWIEVPEGAEILLLDKSCGEDVFYFVKHDGEVFHEYYIDATDVPNNTWIKGTIKELHKGMGEVLWQRNPETPNTSIQDKLKFIEKWLNGEKIQYILGVESEKTQWHNFTEGGMRYIKRSDIKFREAPKYVTINGIEFKSVEKLLKYVKKNFDLEDGE